MDEKINRDDLQTTHLERLIRELKQRHFISAMVAVGVMMAVYVFGNPVIGSWFCVHYIPEMVGFFFFGQFVAVKGLRFPQITWKFVVAIFCISVNVPVLFVLLIRGYMAVFQVAFLLGVTTMLSLPFLLGYALERYCNKC